MDGGKGITYEDLKNCAALAREAKSLQTFLEWYRDMASCPTPATQGIPVQSEAPSPDRIGEWVDKITEVSERFSRVIDLYTDHILEVDLAISEVGDSDQRTILRLRYLDGLTWDEISERTHYSRRWCIVLHNRAMDGMGIAGKECIEVHGNCMIS